MARIASIGTVAHGSPLVEVRLDSGERLRVHSRRLAGRCAPGATADTDTLGRWAAADLAEQRLLRLIARRARSRAELAYRLAAWGVDDPSAAEVIGRLESLGLVDDRALAEQAADRRRRRGHGRLQIEADLERLQIDPDHARAVSAAARGDDGRAARELVMGRYGRVPLDAATTRSAAALLARRGFDEETVAAVLDLDRWS